jgi:hypothetical protein
MHGFRLENTNVSISLLGCGSMQLGWVILLFVVSSYCLAEPFVQQAGEGLSPWRNMLGGDNLIELDKIAQRKANLWNTTSVMIPLADGVELYTLISFPLDWKEGDQLSYGIL